MKKRKWILVAEDDLPMAELTTQALSSDDMDWDVVVAHDGSEAMDCLRRHGRFHALADGDPAIVLLDLKMPRMDGLEVLRQIRSDARFKYLPVVVFSSSREVADLRRCYQFGANAFVVKPMNYRKYAAMLGCLGQFWVFMNELPPPESHGGSGVFDPPQLAAV